MGKTGTIDLSCSKKWKGEIFWSESSQSIDDNYTRLYVCATMWKTDGYLTSSNTPTYGTITIDGTSYDLIKFQEFKDEVCIYEDTLTIYHNSDGAKSVPISLRCNGQANTSLSGIVLSGSGTAVLTQIPRDASLLSAENFTDEGNPTITYENKAGNGMGTFQAAIYSSDGSTAYAAYRNITKTATSYTFNLTTTERNNLRNAMANAKSLDVRFYLKYVIGSTTKYAYLDRVCSITNASPTLNPSVVDTDTTIIALTGNSSKLVKYYSDAKITIGAGAVKGATVSSQKCLNSGYTLSSDGTFTNIESNVFKFTVTDSRGYSATQTLTPTMIEYVKLTQNFTPKISIDGNVNLSISGNYFNGSFGAVNNTLSVSYRYKIDGGSYSSWTAVSPSYGTNNYTCSVSFALTNFDYRNSYVFQVKANDKLISLQSDEYLVNALPVFDWGANDFNFNVPVVIMGSPVYVDTVLYDNYGGSPSTITLADNVSNYDYIEIYYNDNNSNGAGYTKIHSPDGKEVHLSLVESAGSTACYIRHCNYTISGNTITPETSTASYVYFNGSSWSASNSNYLRIYRVVGYKGVG